MAADQKTKHLGKMILVWALVLGVIGGIIGFWLWRSSQQAPAEGTPGLGFMIIMVVLGGFFLITGVLAYLLVIFTQCLTFDFNQPVWEFVKKKLYFANILVPVAVILGVGFLVSAFITPLLARFNLPGSTSFMLPVIGAFGVLQLGMIWVGLWTPLEKRVISRRLMALGLTPEQMQGGHFVGLSNPAITSHLKRWWGVEEDVGMLWLTPEQLIYWGDRESFGITREQLLDAEQKADTRSNTMLSGTKHVILHLQLPDGNTRQIRLHTEGVWTMGGKRRASDELAGRINAWRFPAAVAA